MDELHDLVVEETIYLSLQQCVLRSCCRTDNDMRQIFDSNTPPFGAFMIDNCNSDYHDTNIAPILKWRHRTLAQKIQTRLTIKEMCGTKHPSDLFGFTLGIRYIDIDINLNQLRTIRLYVFNNDGLLTNNLDWDGKDLQRLVYVLDRDFSRMFATMVATKKRINFLKKCVYYMYLMFKHVHKMMRYP